VTEYLWYPPPDVVEAANSIRFARAHGLDCFDALVTRSIEDPEWFWDAVVNHLGLVFARPYERVLDDSDGIEWARWFVGGELNLSWNCVDRHVDTDVDAIRWEREDGGAGRLSYRQLREEVHRVAGGLSELGVRSSDRVCVMMPMVPEAIIAFYAIVRLGAIVVPMFSGFSGAAVATRLSDASAVCLITARTAIRRGVRIPLAQTAADAAREAGCVRALVILEDEHPASVVSEFQLPPDCRCVPWHDLYGRDAAVRPVPAEHPMMICYTSGTTGHPKGAVHVHGGFLVKTAQEVYFQADLKAGDALFWLSDMGWIMAPWAFVGTHANGRTLVIYDGAPDVPDPGRLWAVAERHRITFLGLSPTLVRALRPHGAELARRYDLSSVRVFGSAGEPWNPEPYRWLFEDIGQSLRPVINLSGGTEVGSSFLSADVSIPLRACTLGRPALGMAVDVYGGDGRPARRGEVGELVCKKPWPSMTRGLWGDPDRYLATYWRRWPGVWVHGDWASVDVDGSWFLHGRSDDTLNVAGKRIGAAEYESVLADHGAVRDACAVGRPHRVKGETAHCFVVLSHDATPSEALRAELHGRIDARLGKAFHAGGIWFVERVPRTRSGKIVRRAVRAILSGQSPGDVSTLEDAGALEEIRAVGSQLDREPQ
jgi:acetyl-CoA synthetase